MNLEAYLPKDYNHVFTKLQDYMLTHNRVQFFSLRMKNKEKEKEKEKSFLLKKERQPKGESGCASQVFYPSEKDSLFWCFYVIHHGLMDYQMLQHKNIVFEKKIKIEYVEKMRKSKQLLKTYKFAALSAIENTLVNELKMDETAFLTLGALENINILFFKKNAYYELLMNDSDKYYIVKKSKIDKYGFEIMNKVDADNYKTKFFKIENLEKPLKCMAYYKVDDLKLICSQLGVGTTPISTLFLWRNHS